MAATVAFPETAWRGLFRQYRDLIGPISEAYDCFHWAALASVSATCIGRDCVLPFGPGSMPPLVFTCTVAPTGMRKSVAIDDVETIVARWINNRTQGMKGYMQTHYVEKLSQDIGAEAASAAPPCMDCISGSGGSGEGFAERVADRDYKLPGAGKDDPKMVQTGRRCLYLTDELSMLLGKINRDQAGSMTEFILKAFDAKREWNATTTRGRTIQITDGIAVFLAATTEESLLRRLTDDMVMEGLANRFLWFAPDGPRKPPIPQRPELTFAQMEQFRCSFLDCLKSVWAVGKFSYTAEARALHDGIYRENYEAKHDTMIGRAVSTRTDTNAIRLSMLLAFADGTATIRPEHVQAAWDVARYSTAVINDIGTRRQTSESHEVDERLIVAIRRFIKRRLAAPNYKQEIIRFTRKEIVQNLHKCGISAFEISRSWNSLVENDVIDEKHLADNTVRFEYHGPLDDSPHDD